MVTRSITSAEYLGGGGAASTSGGKTKSSFSISVAVTLPDFLIASMALDSLSAAFRAVLSSMNLATGALSTGLDAANASSAMFLSLITESANVLPLANPCSVLTKLGSILRSVAVYSCEVIVFSGKKLSTVLSRWTLFRLRL